MLRELSYQVQVDYLKSNKPYDLIPMRRIRTWLPLAVLLLFLSGCDMLGIGPKTIEVNGKVVELKTDKPIPNIAVGIYGRNGCVDLNNARNCSTPLELTKTDSEGLFYLKHEPTGEFAFIFLFINPDEDRNYNYGQEVDLLKEGQKVNKVYPLVRVNPNPDPAN